METLEAALQLYRHGDMRGAASLCERRLAAAPDDLDALTLLGDVLTATGGDERAAAVFARIVELQPRDAAARRRWGGALSTAGRAAEAADVLRMAVALEPTNARGHNNLGQASLQLGDLTAAIASFQEALRLDPRYVIAHINLGLAHDANDDPERALTCFEHALAEAPEKIEAWLGRGSALARLHRFEPALACFTRSLELKPGDPSILTHLAGVLLSMERAPESLAAADAALRIDGRRGQVHNVRAGALRRLGRRAEALAALEAAVTLDPRNAEAWGNHSTVLHEMGRFDEAVVSCRRALDLAPDDMRARTRLLARLIPSVPRAAEEVSLFRNAFDAQMAQLQAWLMTAPITQPDALVAAQQQFFYLSYEEQSNRLLLEAYRGACAARLGDFAATIAPPRVVADAAGNRLRLAFVSAHVRDHSVFNAISRGWLGCLDRRRFDISLFAVDARQDACTAAAAACVEHVELGARGVTDWARAIRDRQFDAIIFPEVGMNETTLALASLRLAHRQYVAWGHPETTGLPTLDGYLSADLFEPAGAQDHYTEPLVRLPNLGVYCQPYAVPETHVDLDSLGIPTDRPMFICPGVPFKYRPQHDAILVDIARRLGRSTFVFFDHEIVELSHKLQSRLAAAFAAARLDPEEHLRWIPWQPRPAFFALLRQADVYLDTIGFSGFNTFIQAIQCHLPCVTYQGRFLRGRLGSGILVRLGMPQWIAHDVSDYIDIAVRLAEDAHTRAGVRTAIRDAEHRLYADSSTIDALGSYLLESRGR